MNARTGKFALPGERAATLGFAAYLGLAYLLILFHFGKDEWFVKDDWNLLLPPATSNLFAPVEQHWSTIPMLIYRAYFHFFGARYFPFLATVSALHLTSVALLRAVMIRAGARTWAATLGAALLVLFGAGFMSIVFAIQITQNLSIVLGLSQMILADHDGRIDGRDWAGLFLGALSLMCSGLAPVLVIGIGVAALARRGLGAAAFHTAPLALLYGAWWNGHRDLQDADLYRLPYSQSHPLLYAWRGISGSMAALGHSAVIAVALWAALLAGSYLALASRGWTLRRSGISMALGLLVCAPLYFAVLGLQRSRLDDSYVLFSHHVYTAVCFVLPALACAADALSRRVQRAAPVLSALALVLIPLNAWGFGKDEIRDPPNRKSTARLTKQLILSVAHSPYRSSAANVDVTRHIAKGYAPGLTLGWLLDQTRLGRIPEPGPLDPWIAAYTELFYGVSDLGYPEDATCSDSLGELELRPNQGDTIAVGSPVLVADLKPDTSGKIGIPFTWPDGSGHVLRIELPGMHLLLKPVGKARTFSLCRNPVVAQPFEKLINQRTAEAIRSDPKAMAALRSAIATSPAAMEALRREMAKDPTVMENLRKAIAPGLQSSPARR